MEEHRRQLDSVIALGGSVDMKLQCWYPYEVIELCKNSLEAGHEREFAACAGIVLHNMLLGNDKGSDIDWMLQRITPYKEALPAELLTMLNDLLHQVATDASSETRN
jgi:hypothetical protein